MYFWFGWLTLGILWYIGALGRKVGQRPYERRQVAVVLAVTAVAFLALGLFGARPSAVLGVDGGSLQSSVGSSLVLGSVGDCERIGDRVWRCSRYDSEYSSSIPYRVKVNRSGCWQARSIGFAAKAASRPELAGCVTLYDFVFS